MISRRGFLRGSAGLGASLALSGLSACRPGTWLNDVHSRLNRTWVERVMRPQSAAEVADAVRASRRAGKRLSLAGGYHAMGGQQLAHNAWHLDLRGLRAPFSLDPEAGIVEVGAGMHWPELMDRLERAQPGVARPWGIVQKQTGADRLSLGGALSAAAHGRGLALAPIGADVASFTLIDAEGGIRTCSRSEEPELFSLALGGYGLFGVIASVRLRLRRRTRLERVVEVIDARDLSKRFAERIAEGFWFGDFQYATDRRSGDVLRRGVFSCYRPTDPDAPTDASRSLGERDWRELLVLAHREPARAFERYADYYLTTSGQVYDSDEHQRSIYIDDYHRVLGGALGHMAWGSEMISELYVPREALGSFLERVREDVLEHDVPVIYGTVRLVERDRDSYLAWAREPWACIIFNLHTQHDRPSVARTAEHFRRLIDRAREFGGSYFLTYHRWASREQVLGCHPRMESFLEKKRAADPEERFTSDWYRHHRRLVQGGSEVSSA